MLEATPGKPWGIGFKDLLDVEPNMKCRYVAQKAFSAYILTLLSQTEDRQGAHGGERVSNHLDNVPSIGQQGYFDPRLPTLRAKAAISICTG